MFRPLTFSFVSVALCAAAAAQTPLHLQHVCGGLGRPVLVTAPPNDLERIFVVDQPGRIRIVKNGVLLPTPFLDITGQVTFGGEAGLLGLAFHPNYASNGQFFVFYCATWLQSVVVRYTVSANPDLANAASGTVLISPPMVYGNHNSGMVAFGPDGMLHISVGDGGSTPPTYPDDPFNHAQRGDSLLGKILRIDVDHPAPPLAYGIPADNPFVGPGDPRDEIWAMGLRNPYRFSFDRLTGDMWIADVGGWFEEIDFEPAGGPGGRNYGWSCMAGSHCNTGSTVCTCNDAALTPPLHEYWFPWQLERAIIGGYVYRGSAIPDLRGCYFFADYSQKVFWSLRQVGGLATQLIDRTAELTAPAPLVLGRPTGFGEDAYGELYVCTFTGDVYKIVPNGTVIVGVSPFGTGTPGCTGAHTLTAANSPVIGNPAFTLRCDHGPPPGSGFGIGVFASDPDAAGSDPLGWGFLLHVQVTSPLLLLSAMLPDAAGVGAFALALPPDPILTGLLLYAQGVWIWSPSVCTPTPSGWSSSHGMSIVVQP